MAGVQSSYLGTFKPVLQTLRYPNATSFDFAGCRRAAGLRRAVPANGGPQPSWQWRAPQSESPLQSHCSLERPQALSTQRCDHAVVNELRFGKPMQPATPSSTFTPALQEGRRSIQAQSSLTYWLSACRWAEMGRPRGRGSSDSLVVACKTLSVASSKPLQFGMPSSTFPTALQASCRP